jgi:hypothetical protein
MSSVTSEIANARGITGTCIANQVHAMLCSGEQHIDPVGSAEKSGNAFSVAPYQRNNHNLCLLPCLHTQAVSTDITASISQKWGFTSQGWRLMASADSTTGRQASNPLPLASISDLTFSRQGTSASSQAPQLQSLLCNMPLSKNASTGKG